MTKEPDKQTSVFDYNDYKKFLTSRLSTTGENRGARSRLAAALNCQTAFISQVLNGDTHFSLEHAVLIEKFLKLAPDEAHFFMLLVHLGRAGSKTLQDYYHEQIQSIRSKREKIQERIHVNKSLSLENQMTYYSWWIYGAAHVLVSIPGIQTRQALSEKLKLPIKKTSEVVDFLLGAGLIEEEKGLLNVGETRIHLSANHPLISKHHANLRALALQTLDTQTTTDLHYSAMYTIAFEDAPKVKEKILKLIEELHQMLGPSKEELGCGIGIDFFRFTWSI